MKGSVPASLRIFVCPECQGRGVVMPLTGEPGLCLRCRGTSVVGSLNDGWLVWRKPFSSLAIAEQHVERLSRGLVNGILFLFGLLGLLVGFWQLTLIIEQGRAVSSFLTDRSLLLGFFWLSCVCDLYILYRLDRERLTPSHIPQQRAAFLKEAPTSFDDFLGGQHRAVDIAAAFHQESLRAIESAWLLAKRMRHREFLPVHVLATVVNNNAIASMFVRLNISSSVFVQKLRHVLGTVPRADAGDPALSPAVLELFVRAYAHAAAARRHTVDPPDLLAAILETESRARDILEDLSVSEQRMRNVIAWVSIQRILQTQWQHYRSRALFKPKGVMDRAMTAQATPILDHFSEDLTQLARIGALPYMVDREREMDELFRIIESGKGNILLIGNPGVGKTSIIQGIAERMATEDVPKPIQDKRLIALSVPALVAGAGAIGELEQRLSEILIEIRKSGNIVLVIENIHDLVGVTSAGGETLDLSDALAEALRQQHMTVIATTTPSDYRQHIEQGTSLGSIFSSVAVNEVDENAAILICEARAGNIEYRQKVFFSYAAIEAAVKLSTRYIHDRNLPEKAIDVLEETAVAVAAAKGKRAVVTDEDVARVVSEKSGVEVTAVSEREGDKLLHLEERLHERIVGQDEAVSAVAAALRRSRAELRDPKRPIANFLFLGPTGVGKTELAKTVAQVYFGNESDMVRLDMSEYQDGTSLMRLLGSSGRGGYLTESIRNNPYTILLLDELEKAHEDVLNLFLQVMDDGRLTDASGRTIDFTNAILIATSNAATPVIQERITAGKNVDEIKRELLAGLLLQWFHPEFVNRFDDVIVFKPLSSKEIQKIARLVLAKVQEQLAGKGITLKVTDAAIVELADAGFDPLYGARPLRRVIQDRVDNALATYLLSGKIARRDVAVLDAGGVIRVEKAEEV